MFRRYKLCFLKQSQSTHQCLFRFKLKLFVFKFGAHMPIGSGWGHNTCDVGVHEQKTVPSSRKKTTNQRDTEHDVTIKTIHKYRLLANSGSTISQFVAPHEEPKRERGRFIKESIQAYDFKTGYHSTKPWRI